MKVPFINNVDKSFVNDIKAIISEAPGVFQSDKNRLIAWLEKQVEQKPQGKSILEAIKEEKVDNANKEFVDKGYEDGDWVVNNNGGSQFYQVITRSWPDSKIKGAEDNLESFINTATLDKQYHLWTIEDAKDGDVLVTEDKDKIFLYNGKLDLKGRVCAYCGIYKSYDGLRFSRWAFANYFTYKEPYPATKEQRDLLFQKMEEEGYEWDAKKKELKKIEKKPANTVKPKFREGDSIQFKGFGHNRYTIKEVCGLSHYINTMGNRMDMSYTDANFEAIKDAEKQNEQKHTDKVEPKFRVKYAGSEYNVLEVKEIAGIIFYGIEDEPHHIDYVRPDHCDIISGYGVKEKGNPYPTESAIFLEQNTAWSEADDAMRNFIALILRNHQSDEDFTTFETTFKDCIDWFKSIKERVQPQPQQELSEEDERIRKWCISHFRECFRVTSDNVTYQEYLNNKVIPWLEKQGENNMGISEATKQKLEDNLNKALEKETPESWNEFLEGQGEQKPTDKVEPKFKVGDRVRGIISDIPYFITKVCDNYYTTESGCVIMFRSQDNFVLCEQKTAWSEEDEKMLGKCIDAASGYYSPEDKPNMKDWLRAVKDRVQPQPKQEWSEEDKKMFDSIINVLEVTPSASFIPIKRETMIPWLKSLKERVKPKQKQELNEDTQQWIDAITKDYEEWYKVNKDHSATIQIKINILKSLKDRYTWEPSKEQIMALRWVLNHMVYDSHKEEINGLLEQLLKLYNYGENR